MSLTMTEIQSQPELWRRAATQALAPETLEAMPKPGESVAVIGCGTSWFMAQAYCSWREAAGQGVSDPFTATEFPTSRKYDRLVFLSRSGTTSEIIDLMAKTQASTPNVLITAVAPGPASPYATAEILLDYADEESVVQTRFATSALVLMLSSLNAGFNGQAAAEDCEKALAADLPEAYVQAEQISFLGTGWTIGLANEAGLKLREASQSWTETYPAMEYRHGPIAIAQPGRLTWVFGPVPKGMEQQVAATGATLVPSELNPLAHLVFAQRLAVARAEDRGLNPDTPRHLTRSVILDPDQIA